MCSTSMPGDMKLLNSIFLALLVWSIHQETGAFDLSGPKTYQVLIGSDVILRCTFNVDQLPVDTKFLAIHWFFIGKQVLTYDNVLNVSRPGLSMDLQAALMGDASLRISKVKISDKGVYKCLVVYSPQSKMKEITLDVQARPSVKVVAKSVSRDEENMLHCSITGFYPLDITITWLCGAEAIDTYVTYKPHRQEDGTYSVNSTVVIIPTDDNWNETITCKVTHPSMQYPLLETYRLTLRGSLDLSCVSIQSLLIGVPSAVFLVAALVTCWIWRTPVCRPEDDDDDDDEAPRPPQNRHSRCSQMSCRSTEEEISASTEKDSLRMSQDERPSSPVPPRSGCSRPSSPDPGSSSPAVEDPLAPFLRDVVEQGVQQSGFFSRSPGSVRSLRVTFSLINESENNPDHPDNTGLRTNENRWRRHSAGNLQENDSPTGYQTSRPMGGRGTGHFQIPDIKITSAVSLCEAIMYIIYAADSEIIKGDPETTSSICCVTHGPRTSP
ncbi:tyrosine-protein phosphatase non-receptor type substrate 1-like isoform X2 [Bufo gargarizans]|uniref:tyrosine-protein phosphatase non-receptor type substrate 1-like isoform X2 n=1 Tax=Bufo gargarizans TaxID=30331 RepID=UPI001CF3D309|nr:tyrosine-protein phosphatase non-receptor type substrate 1-like isoform X2 [Bufo gargarizans]